jgi:hypothetical protein
MKRILIPALIALGLTAAVACSGTIEDPTATTKPVTGANSTSAAPAAKGYSTPHKADFKLTVKETERQCFGSAGCNVTFHVKVAMTRVMVLDPDKTYELTYKIRGAEDSYTNTLELTGEDYSTDKEENVSTASDVKLVAVVTDIEEV